MSGHLAWSGVTCDHLYPDCPAIARWRDSPFNQHGVGRVLQGLVDPAGTDICGLCSQRWKDDELQRRAEAYNAAEAEWYGEDNR